MFKTFAVAAIAAALVPVSTVSADAGLPVVETVVTTVTNTTGQADGAVSSLVNGVGQVLTGVGGKDGLFSAVGEALPAVGGVLSSVDGVLSSVGGLIPSIGSGLVPERMSDDGKASKPSQNSDSAPVGRVIPNAKATADAKSAPFKGSPASLTFQDLQQPRRLRANEPAAKE